jgi:hypothetical protein
MNSNSCTDNTINYYFIGNKEDLKNEPILKYFDTNLIPLNNILLSYYPTLGSKNINDPDLTKLLNKLNDNRKIYNNYNIYPILITIILIIIIILIFILRFLFIYYNSYYGYILLFILLALIIIGSIWFIYINNETL